jgi:hypothetical protein
VRAVLKRLLLLGLAVLVLAGVALVWLTPLSGRTPSEILRYVERRLEGHPRLEAVASPMLAVLRTHWSGSDVHASPALFQVPVPAANPAVRQALATGAIDTAAPPRDVIRVGPGRAVMRIADAARLARDGDTIEIDPGDYVADVAVWDRARLTIRGKGPKVRLIAAGAIAQGKAIWVIRRGEVRIEDIEFIGAKAADRNGAAIRLEGGQLTVRRCLFYGNETGILTGAGEQTSLVVEDSEFAYNGHGDGQSHHLYAGALASLTVTGSYFHHGNVGHNIKSRAARSRIAYNRLADESGGQASYELEFPDGGLADVIGNVVQQSATTRNSVMVSYGAEGLKWPHNALRLIHNTLVNDHPDGGTFVRVHGIGTEVLTRNNLHVGKGRWIVASEATDSAGDAEVDWRDLVRPTREDWRLNERGRQRLAGALLGAVDPAMTPEMEYTHPARRSRLRGPPHVPGALQGTGP